MTRLTRTIAATALAGGLAAAGTAMAQDGPMEGPMMGPMMGPGRGGLDFAAIDSDGNGSLSRSELNARAVARLSAADANGDGILDRAEIIAAMPGPHGGLGPVFSADPGEIYADRLLALMGATEAGQIEVAALADQRVNLLLVFADTDRDAAISQAEADAMREHRHARMERHRGGWRHWMDRHGPKGEGPEGSDAPSPRG